MAKISQLPFLANPTGDESVPAVDAAGVTHRAGLRDLVETAAQPLVARAEKAAVDAEAFTADLRTSLSVRQTIGLSIALVGGNTSGNGTYTFAASIVRSGKGVKVTYFGMAAGTAYLHIANRAGITNTIEREYPFLVQPGEHTVNFPSVAFAPGQYVGYRSPAGLLTALAGSAGNGFDGYWSTSGPVPAGSSYDDASIANADFQMRIELSSLAVTADGVRSIQKQVGDVVPTPQQIGFPSSAALVTGTNVGTSTYVFASPVTEESTLQALEGFSLVPGTYALRRYLRAGTAMTRAGIDVIATITTENGPFALTEVPELILGAGEYLGIKPITGRFAVNATTDVATPYWAGSADGTSFVGGTPNSSVTLNIRAKLLPRNLTNRVDKLEKRGGGNALSPLTHATEALIAVWSMGESHIAGRGTGFASAIPAGRGYAYRRATTSLALLADPTGNDATATTGTGRGSYGPAIGQTMLDATHGAVGAVIVNSAEGGTRLSEWIDAGPMWSQAKADWNAAMAAAKARKVPVSGVCIVINIGSNDAAVGTSKALYKTRYTNLINAARAYVNAGPNVPVLLVMTNPQRDGNYAVTIAEYQAAIAELSRELAYVFVASSATKYAVERNWFQDNVHLAQTANDAIGGSIGALAVAFGMGHYPALLD